LRIHKYALIKIVLHDFYLHNHKGLTTEERKIIEQGYRDGYINILVATSTLAAGVNLPANRVIIRAPMLGRDELSVASFRQMCGRAGRTNLNTHGEAILMIDDKISDKKLALKLIFEEVQPLMSALHCGYGGSLEKLLLEAITCRILKNELEVSKFISCTFICVQRGIDECLSIAASAIDFIKKNRFVLSVNDSFQSNDNSDFPSGKLSLVASSLGIATVFSGINPLDSIDILQTLSVARKNFIIRSNFHAIFLVTPTTGGGIEPPWDRFEEALASIYSEYPDIEKVAIQLGVNYSELLSYKRSPPSNGTNTSRVKFYRRLYAAVILYRLIQEVPLQKLEKVVNVDRGKLQNLQKEAASFCNMIVVFCKKLNWTFLASAVSPFADRLSFGVHDELVPLARIGSEMPSFRARVFFQNGIRSPSELIDTDKETIVDILMSIIPFENDNPFNAASKLTAKRKHNDANSTSMPTFDPRQPKDRLSCERLANAIILKCQKLLRDEVESCRIIERIQRSF